MRRGLLIKTSLAVLVLISSRGKKKKICRLWRRRGLSGREHHGFTRRAGAWVQAAGVGHGSRSRADLRASQRRCGADKESTTSSQTLVPSLVPPACLSAWDLGIWAGSSRGDLGLLAGPGHAQVALGRML